MTKAVVYDDVMAEKLWSRAAVFILMRNDAGEILLQQRAHTGYLDGFYDFACSGHVDDGESIHEAAVRELQEELGITASPDDLRLVHINQNYLDTPYFGFIFALSKWVGEPDIKEPEKCSDLAYFSPDNLPEKCTLTVRVVERAGFGDTLAFSKVDRDNFEEMTGNTIPKFF